MARPIPATLEALAIPVDRLVPYGENPRRGNVDVIAESLGRHGQYRPIVVRARTFEVLAGNHTLAAAKVLGWPEIAATFVDCTDDEAARIVLVDNRAADLGSYDDAVLAGLLDSLDGDLIGTGYTGADLAELLANVGPDPVALSDVDDAPAAPTEPVTVEGDVWLLGPHRVLCGDSTDAASVLLLLGGAVPDAVWTDPPYGVEYVGKTADALTIRNDGALDLEGLLLGAFSTLVAACRVGAPVYVACPPGPLQLTFMQSAVAAGLVLRQNLVWVKNTMVLGHSDYHYKHEVILEAETPPVSTGDDTGIDPATHETVLYAFTPNGAGALGRGGPRWQGDNKATTVFEFPKPGASREHPTMKPVALVEAMLRNSCQRGGLVLDLFGGSGSTLIAAHGLRLRAALVELDPRYVDVICSRYQRHTGVVPVLERTGDVHDFGGAL